MPNLTTEQLFVKPALDANPHPGHDLVVFRRVGKGQRFHSCLGPDDRLGLMDKLALGSNLVAYAVSRDQNLRHKVSIAGLKSADHVGPFGLDLTLALCIIQPQLLVEKLESDPLGRLEREVQEVLGRVASRMEWSEIESTAYDFEDQLLSTTVLDDSGARVPSLAFLQRFAVELGFQLRGIQVSRQFSEEVGEGNRVARREKEQRRIFEEEKKTALLNQQLESRLKEYEAWQANALGNIQRLGAISQSATSSLAKVLAQISDKVDSAQALRSVMNELNAMRNEIAVLATVGDGGSGSNSEMRSMAGASPAALLASSPFDPVSGLVSRIFGCLNGIPWQPGERNRLYSSLLRLAGELIQDETDDEVVRECCRSLEEQVPTLIKAVQTPEQREILLRLLDPEWLRAQMTQG